MSELALDPSLVALMEIHCRKYRHMYGHLRNDKMAWDQPIPFPHRQMPSFFTLKISTDKNLKIWTQMEKTLFDHYEIPMHFQTYMGVQPRRRMFEAWEFDRMRMVDDDIPPEAEYTTDYNVPRGWKRIPKKLPNSARPSPLLLALIKRSA